MNRIIIVFLLFITARLDAQQVLVKGLVQDENNKRPIAGAVLHVADAPYSTVSDLLGRFELLLPEKKAYRLVVSYLGYQPHSPELRFKTSDTLLITIAMKAKLNLLDSVSVTAIHRPETLVAKPDYSVFDFDFYEDKLLLLTSERSLAKASIQLSDYNGKIFSSFRLPADAGEASHFFRDWEGYSEIVCRDSVFRVDVANTELMVMPIPRQDFNRYLLPVVDTVNDHYYFSDRWEKYPLFNYYYLKRHDSLRQVLNTVTNADLMKIYNMEYYYLQPRQQLEARRIAAYYKADVHIVAALMSGFTQSMFYDPLYAPLFVMRDTICIFNHHNDFLYHYDRQNQLIDSVKITYHHPKNWREWKKKLILDETENKVYAFFSKDEHHYLKLVNHQTGKASGLYKLKHHSAEKIRIRDGYAYYVYRPFGSTQERFLYREKIE